MAAERSGGGDPVRTLALLWRRPPEPKPVGRKPKVSVDQIVTAAIAPQGTSGQVSAIPPTKSTRKAANVTVVLMISAPTQ